MITILANVHIIGYAHDLNMLPAHVVQTLFIAMILFIVYFSSIMLVIMFILVLVTGIAQYFSSSSSDLKVCFLVLVPVI